MASSAEDASAPEQQSLLLDVYFSKPTLTREDVSRTALSNVRWVDTSKDVVDLLEIWPTLFESRSLQIEARQSGASEAFTIVEAMNEVGEIK